MTILNGNPKTISLALGNITAMCVDRSLGPRESILISVAMTYSLKGTSQPVSSYPRDYSDTATAAAWTQPYFTGTKFTGTFSAFFTAYAKVVS